MFEPNVSAQVSADDPERKEIEELGICSVM